MTKKTRCTLWTPEWPKRDDNALDPAAGEITPPANAIGVNVDEPEYSRVDRHVLHRALSRAGYAGRLVEPDAPARNQPEYLELTDFTIEYRIDGKRHPLPRPHRSARLHGERHGQKGFRVDGLYILPIFHNPRNDETVEGAALETDVAFVDPNERGATLDRVVINEGVDAPSVDDLARLMYRAGFAAWEDREDDSPGTQLREFERHAYETAATLLQPRRKALRTIAAMRIAEILDNTLVDGEDLTARIHKRRNRLTVNVSVSGTGPA